MSCKSRHCRYPNTHTTSSHKCGTCNKFGHGQVECSNQNLINNLLKFQNDTLGMSQRCDVLNCSSPDTHNSTAHHCLKCGFRHSENNCIIQSLDIHIGRLPDDEIYLNNFNRQQFIDDHIDSIPTVNPISLGMGCQLFVKLEAGTLSALFFHSDAGYDENELKTYGDFIENCIVLAPNTYCESPVEVEQDIPTVVPEQLILCPL